MKRSLKKLQLLLKFINIEDFFLVDFRANEIIFQGFVSNEKLIYYSKWFEFEDKGRHFVAIKYNVEIVLSKQD